MKKRVISTYFTSIKYDQKDPAKVKLFKDYLESKFPIMKRPPTEDKKTNNLRALLE